MTCQHHWLLESDTFKDVPGRCKKCGEERVFSNPDVSAYTAPSIPHEQGYLGLSREYSSYGRYSRG